MAKWSIIGAGPVGSMQAVLLATVFPGQEVHVFDQRKTHQRNHGLKIRNNTIDDINAQLDVMANQIKGDVENSSYHQLILENIKKTKAFLKEQFKNFSGGQFVRTKTISNMLQKFAEEMGEINAKILGSGHVNFHMGENYGISASQLDTLKTNAVVDETQLSEAEKILHASSMIFGADGAHSRVRAQIFDDPEPEKDVIQHLVEIKLDMKEKSNSSYYSISKSESIDTTADFIERSILPTLRRGKLHVWNVGSDGTATLHILVKKKIYDTLLEKMNNKGTMGTYVNPYTRLRQLPIENKVRSLIAEAVRDTIGIGNFEPESIKITTIPMHVYIANSLSTVKQNRLYNLVGDAAVGLIFIRGVNNGLQSTIAYVNALFALLKDKSIAEIADYQFSEVPPDFRHCETYIKKMFDWKVSDIKSEQRKIDWVVDSIQSTSQFTSSTLGSHQKIPSKMYDPDLFMPLHELRDLLQNLDNELDRIQLIKDEEGHDINEQFKAYRAWLPALDLLANQLDEYIYELEIKQNRTDNEVERLKKILTLTIQLVNSVIGTEDKKAQRDFIIKYKKDIIQLDKESNTAESSLQKSAFHSVRSMLASLVSYSSSFAFMNNKTKTDRAVSTVVEMGLSIN